MWGLGLGLGLRRFAMRICEGWLGFTLAMGGEGGESEGRKGGLGGELLRVGAFPP